MSDFSLDKYKRLFDLSGRDALVIGGGSGIGQAAAYGFAAHGARCVIADLAAGNAETTAANIRAGGGSAEAFAVDVTSTSQVDALVIGGGSGIGQAAAYGFAAHG